MKVVNGDRLYRGRRRAGYYQADLARLIKRSQQYISALENGTETTCSEEVADKICRFLGLELEDVFAYPEDLGAPEVTSVGRGSRVGGDRVTPPPRGAARPPVRRQRRKDGAA